jgi:hypothetical protein
MLPSGRGWGVGRGIVRTSSLPALPTAPAPAAGPALLPLPHTHITAATLTHPQIAPKREGLLHVSEWGFSHVRSAPDVVKEGDRVDVMVTELQVGAGAAAAAAPARHRGPSA